MNITYVFTGGRKKSIETKEIKAREHYYSASLFKDEGYELKIIEFEDTNTIFSKIFYYYDRILNKFLSLPSYTHKLCSIRNLKILMNTDKLYLVTESAAFSCLPFLIILKIFRKTEVNIFVMGLYSKKMKYKKMEPIHFMFIKLLTFLSTNILFLGKGEMTRAKLIHSNCSKFSYIGFCTDVDFWSMENDSLIEKKEDQILFIGNDSNKDGELLINVAKKLPDLKFLVISKLTEFNNIKVPNIKVIDGSWDGEIITDEELRVIYKESTLTITPLRDSFQPSGQSVVLQSMCIGTPAMISNTEGFWDKDKFNHNKNIFFVSPNSTDEWVDAISKTLNNKKLLDEVSKNSILDVKEYFNLQTFHNSLKTLTF